MRATRAEQFDDGRERRALISIGAHGDWAPAQDRPDPVDVLATANDGRLEELIPIRFGRMAESPFAFLRGGAAVMAADLSRVPTTGIQVQLSGDSHLMNFGLFATPERNVSFGLNDFDETMRGPWEWDVKRLVASLVVASQDVGLGDGTAESIAVAGARAYRHRMAELATLSPLDVYYDRIDLAELIEEAPKKKIRKLRKKMLRKAHRRVAENLYPKLVANAGGDLRIVDQPPLIFHVDDVTPDTVQGFFDNYRSSLPVDMQFLLDLYVLRDVAVKVVGVGSVGTRCYAVLFTDDDGNPLLLQVKEANNSVLAAHLPTRSKKRVHNGERVVIGQRLLQAVSDIFLGHSTSPAGRDFYVRQLRDMKLSVRLGDDEDQMTRYAEYCGMALARAHANTGSASAITGYLGDSDTVDRSLGQFGLAYAEQTVRDHEALVEAIDKEHVPARFEAR